MTTGKKIASVAMLALVGAACTDTSQSLPTSVPLHVAGAEQVLMTGVSDFMDGSSGGNPNFLWLPPVVGGGVTPPGPFVSGLEPLVEICDKDNNCTTGPAVEEDDHYQLGLKSGIDEKPRDGSPYRIRAFDANMLLLGSFVVSLDTNRNIPIKFWVGEGFLEPEAQECVDDDRCDLGTVVSDIGGTVKVTATDHGETEVIAAAIFPDDWSPGGIDRTVTIDCRNNLPPEIANGNGPLNTGLTQLPWYCDFSVDPALATGQQFNHPVVVEVCETVDVDHGSVVLGKSSGLTDFELLPFVTPVSLGNCHIDYPTTTPAGSASLWSAVTSRLAAVFGGIGPQPLRANMRDGGAGGSVRGFSLINPVIPASISGTLTDSFDEGVGNVSVTLSNGDVVVTSPGGQYSFLGLDTASYTVTVDTSDPDFPSFETLVENEAQVDVTGSGDFSADFQTRSQFVFVAGTEDGAQAEQACVVNFRGHLASIHSQAEDDYISRVVDPTGVGNITPWIGAIPNTNSGLFDAGVGANYAWTDGTPWDYNNWRLYLGVQEPNASGPTPAGVQFWPNTNGALSGWNDVPLGANSLSGYVCKVPAIQPETPI